MDRPTHEQDAGFHSPQPEEVPRDRPPTPQEQGDPAPRAFDRRHFLTAAGSVVGLAAAQVLWPSWAETADQSAAPPVPADPTKVPGTPPSPYGQRSRFETASRLPRRLSHSLTPLQDLHGVITPSALHFERHHNGVPLIDPT
ncbi:MAG: hypothetical protein ACREI3_01465, partial [Nitrospirales bacterium]